VIVLFAAVIIGYRRGVSRFTNRTGAGVRLGEPGAIGLEPDSISRSPFHRHRDLNRIAFLDSGETILRRKYRRRNQQRLVVDAFARYRIKNRLRFLPSIRSIQAANSH